MSGAKPGTAPSARVLVFDTRLEQVRRSCEPTFDLGGLFRLARDAHLAGVAAARAGGLVMIVRDVPMSYVFDQPEARDLWTSIGCVLASHTAEIEAVIGAAIDELPESEPPLRLFADDPVPQRALRTVTRLVADESDTAFGLFQAWAWGPLRDRLITKGEMQ